MLNSEKIYQKSRIFLLNSLKIPQKINSLLNRANLRYSYLLENAIFRYSYLNSLHKIRFGSRHPENLRYIEFLRYSHLRYIECQLYAEKKSFRPNQNEVPRWNAFLQPPRPQPLAKKETLRGRKSRWAAKTPWRPISNPSEKPCLHWPLTITKIPAIQLGGQTP